MFGSTTTMVEGLTNLGPGSMNWEELEKLQSFVNRGKSAILMKDYPDLQTIFATHTGEGPRDANAVVDILFAFIHEGGQPGSTYFRTLVTKMVEKDYLKSTVIDALGDFLPAGGLPTDGNRIHEF